MSDECPTDTLNSNLNCTVDQPLDKSAQSEKQKKKKNNNNNKNIKKATTRRHNRSRSDNNNDEIIEAAAEALEDGNNSDNNTKTNEQPQDSAALFGDSDLDEQLNGGEDDQVASVRAAFADSELQRAAKGSAADKRTMEAHSTPAIETAKTNGTTIVTTTTKPVNLVLNAGANVALGDTDGSEQLSPYCPLTPRRIVDDDGASHSDGKRGARDGGEGNGEAYDADDFMDDEEPDEELLVQFLGEANRIAEARLAARRQARSEAREIRMRELERQQKEQEQNADRVFDMHTASGVDPLSRTRLASGIGVGVGGSPSLAGLITTRGNSMSSRRSSEDSLEEEGRSLRDIRHELKDVEERFRKAMIANAQLDNERSSQTYQIQLLKDKLEEMEETYAQLQREFKDKSRDCNALKRNMDKLSEELKLVQGQLSERDTLIADQGLVIVAVENEDGSDAKRALVSVENAQLLGSVQGSLDVRLKKFGDEKRHLQAEVQKLQGLLDNHKTQGRGRGGNTANGPLGADDDYEAQREANKTISDYKYKLQKAEQEIASLQASLARSETQVIRYKSTAEAAEKAEADLKIERRKLQRENRETVERLEELETSNNHLLKRLDKLKNAKSALLKEL